jgi:transposase
MTNPGSPFFFFLPAYSPFLNPIEEFFSTWQWRVFDCNLYAQQNLLEA